MEPKPASKLHETAAPARPNRKIVGSHQDDAGDWVADLECGHTQHVRHNPPWQSRPWVTTPEGRASRIGTELPCAKCIDRFLSPSTLNVLPQAIAARSTPIRGGDSVD
jgi:hypothetical protein